MLREPHVIVDAVRSMSSYSSRSAAAFEKGAWIHSSVVSFEVALGLDEWSRSADVVVDKSAVSVMRQCCVGDDIIRRR